MPHYVTTHSTSGKSIFSPKIPTSPCKLLFGDVEDQGYSQILYSNATFHPDSSKEDDLDRFAETRVAGLVPGEVSPKNGVSCIIFALPPGLEGPLHRTMTLDVVVVLEGIMEFYLDGGEAKTLVAGDSIVLRAAMHISKNVTPKGGWARMLAVSQPVQTPLDFGNARVD